MPGGARPRYDADLLVLCICELFCVLGLGLLFTFGSIPDVAHEHAGKSTAARRASGPLSPHSAQIAMRSDARLSLSQDTLAPGGRMQHGSGRPDRHPITTCSWL